MIFTKTNRAETDNVWFYDMKTDGFSLDDKRTPLISEEQLEECFTNPTSVLDTVKDKCDIPDIITRFPFPLWRGTEGEDPSQNESTRLRTDQSFLVPKADIVANDYDLSINRYKEVIYEEVHYEKPNVLIEQIKELDKLRRAAMDELEKMV